MATAEDVRQLALALPEAVEDAEGGAFRVDGKLFAWPWRERVQPARPRVVNPEVLAVRVASEAEKDALISLEPAIFFTEPHYDGYAAVLVRLPVVPLELLQTVIADAWRVRAPRRLLTESPPSDDSRTNVHPGRRGRRGAR
jgi:hypothetical protein